MVSDMINVSISSHSLIQFIYTIKLTYKNTHILWTSVSSSDDDWSLGFDSKPKINRILSERKWHQISFDKIHFVQYSEQSFDTNDQWKILPKQTANKSNKNKMHSIHICKDTNVSRRHFFCFV